MASIERFLKALRAEIDSYADIARPERPFETIYFGGGTPSLLSPSTVDALLNRLGSRFPLGTTPEITLETNPGTVDFSKLRELLSAGVNRLSIGIQSFQEKELKFLGRIHYAEEARACVRMAYKAGFENVSVDLIFALPGQKLQSWEENLKTAVELSPTHISAYSLIVEEGTPLQKMVELGETVPQSEVAEAEMYAVTMDFLESVGYEHYEVSNYALPGYRSRHNSLYWNHDNYLGFGPSAHSYWEGSPLVGPRRWWNVASIGSYCEKIELGEKPVAGREDLGREDLLLEEIFLSLRSTGIDVQNVRRKFGVDLWDRCRRKIESYLKHEFLVFDDGKLRLTPEGFLRCDGIALDLST